MIDLPVLILLAAAAAESIGPPRLPTADKPSTVEDDNLRQLLKIHRLYVDRLTGGETAAQMRDMLVSALESSKLFAITENQERADVFLRGAAEDLIYTDVHNTSDGINARNNVGTSRGEKTRRILRRQQQRQSQRGSGHRRERIKPHRGAQARSGRRRATGEQRWRRDLVDDAGEPGGEVPPRQHRCRRPNCKEVDRRLPACKKIEAVI